MVEVVTPEVYNKYAADNSSGPFSGIWSIKLRVKITGRDGFEKLDIQIPVSYLVNDLMTIPYLCLTYFVLVKIKEIMNKEGNAIKMVVYRYLSQIS